MMPNRYIYTLSDPFTGNVRYVGQSVKPKNRLRRHLLDAPFKRTHKECWIYGLLQREAKPIIDILDIGNIENIDALEIYWIEQLRQWGFPLVNIEPGGQKSKSKSKETIEKIRKSLTGKKQSRETIEKRSRSLAETWKNPELRELKRRQTIQFYKDGFVGRKGSVSPRKGISLPVEQRQKVSKGLKKYYENHSTHNKRNELVNVFDSKMIPIALFIDIDNACSITEKSRHDIMRHLRGKTNRIGNYILKVA